MAFEAIVHGWDISGNHAGFSEIRVEGTKMTVTWWGLVSTTYTALKPEKKGHTWRVPAKKAHQDTDNYSVMRLIWWSKLFRHIVMTRRPTHVVIEHYALGTNFVKGRKQQVGGQHTIAEVGGAARIITVANNVSLRLIPSKTAKKIGCGNGNGSKGDMVEAANRLLKKGDLGGRYPLDASIDTHTDLADALHLARAGVLELWVKEGLVRLSDLSKPEREALISIPKSRESLVDRDWITKQLLVGVDK